MAANYTNDFFISYRRAGDGKVLARNVNDLLEKYGKSVFLDVDDLTMGYYRQELVDAIEQSQYYILILSKETWREQESIDDYYREIIKIGEEIKSADKDVLLLELDKPNDSIPDILAKKLKESDFDLPHKQKVKYSHEKGSHNFEYDLCRALRIEYKETDFTKKFSLVIPKNLLPRDKEVEKLFNGIKENRFFNLVGVGGMGKTSLAYLMVKRHKYYFNEIAYAVVNNNIKDDIVDQLNKTLKLNFEEDAQLNRTLEIKKDAYTEIITYLQENFQSEKPNLLVLDINETADGDKNSVIINEIIKNNDYLKGWKFLILSRESVDTRKIIQTYSLTDKEDFEFLKGLFLSKAGERYKKFKDFEGLFKVIYYNPLLAEQLGLFLSDEPKKATLDDIKNILGDTLRKKEIQGTSAQRHDEKIISFLKNLIVYDKLEVNEKALLRHFVLWQADYISYDVIADLLKGVFESDDELTNTLKSLLRRAIITTNNKETLSYKLHGLLAESLRKQIDIPNEDYSIYLSNVKRITIYDEFQPFVDCIGNSLCEYDITNDYRTLNSVAFKSVGWLKYSKTLYNKVVEILLDKISSDKDNPVYQNDMAEAYLGLAFVQGMLLKDNESAKDNYNNAIKIRQQLPKDNSKYQNELAMTHCRFADFQYHLSDFKSAVSTCEEARDIYERLPKDNYEYQKNLAVVYLFLAVLRYRLGDVESAKSNYEKAIDIGETLPKDNTEYQKCLADSYYYLAELQKDQKEYDSAESNIKSAIKTFQSLSDLDSELLSGLLSSKCVLAEIYILRRKLNTILKAIKILNKIRPLLKDRNWFLCEKVNNLSDDVAKFIRNSCLFLSVIFLIIDAIVWLCVKFLT